MIDLTPAAAQELQRIQAQDETGQKSAIVSLQLVSSPCGDYCYDLGFISQADPSDTLFERQGWAIAIPSAQVSLVQGLRLDYVEDLMGGGFRFHNPQANQTCGCGLAFSLGKEPVRGTP